jgi:hypothetical protein
LYGLASFNLDGIYLGLAPNQGLPASLRASVVQSSSQIASTSTGTENASLGDLLAEQASPTELAPSQAEPLASAELLSALDYLFAPDGPQDDAPSAADSEQSSEWTEAGEGLEDELSADVLTYWTTYSRRRSG